jgi:AcrR family transcriptional regulator
VGAFIALVAERGLETVTIEDVASRSGVSRTAIRHFVGNRSDLIASAIASLVTRYEMAITAHVGPEPDARELVGLLFGDVWVSEATDEDRAFRVLEQEAIGSSAHRSLIRDAYAALVKGLVEAMRRSGATAPAKQLTDAAYLIVCLSEQNVTLQGVGFARVRGRAAARLASEILDRVLPDESATSKWGVKS